MILVKRAPAAFIAHLYAEDEPEFNISSEESMQRRFEAGERGIAPEPPHTKYGPGGHRFYTNTYLEETGLWSQTLEASITTLRSRKNIRQAEARIKRAERRLRHERKRLRGLLESQRVFEEGSCNELAPVQSLGDPRLGTYATGLSCPDCGERDEGRGHQACQYPSNEGA